MYNALLAIVLAVQAPARDSGATLIGQIRDAKGAPVVGALVEAIDHQIGAWADRRGQYRLRGLPFGAVRVQLRVLEYDPIDTTLTLRRGTPVVWNVVRPTDPELVDVERLDSLRAVAGQLDSVAAGLVSTDTSSGFTYERFGIRLLRAAIDSTSRDTSRVLSPLSAGQALALALGAARDSTALAIARGLSLGSLGSDSLASRSKRFNGAVRARRDITLKIANALWVDTSATLQPAFASWAQTWYGAAVRRQPLRVPEVVPIVNRWADSATAGRIQKIREKPFRDSTVVALTNAVYFKGKWLEPFDSSLTQERAFTTSNGSRVTVPTMEETGKLAYRRKPGYQAVRLPYAAGLTAVYLVLPDSGVSAMTVLDELERTGWPIPDRTETREVQLRLPRLRVAQATDLRPAFTALDMGILFDSARADFSGLIVPRPERPPPCPPLSSGVHPGDCTRIRVSDAAQHVYLIVDEAGTEAAAVTAFGFGLAITSAPPPPIRFFLDRPFVFALRDEKTGTFLFLGYIAAPQQ